MENMDAFNELHEEVKHLSYSNNRLKGDNRWLENKLTQLQEENDNLKIFIDALEMIYEIQNWH